MNNKPKRISPQQAKEMMSGNAVVVDVREPDEYISGHIEDAKSAPLSDIEQSIKKVVDDKKTPLLVYCLSGARSNIAVNRLSRLGYENLYDFGGITRWQYGVVR